MTAHYLLMWPSPGKAPEFEPVRILSVRETRDGPWVEFEFESGPAAGRLAGAPSIHVITQKEKSIIESAATEILLQTKQARDLMSVARATYRRTLRSLSATHRTLLPEKS